MYCLLTSLLLLQVEYVDLDSDDDFVSVPKKWRKTNSPSSGPSTLTHSVSPERLCIHYLYCILILANPSISNRSNSSSIVVPITSQSNASAATDRPR